MKREGRGRDARKAPVEILPEDLFRKDCMLQKKKKSFKKINLVQGEFVAVKMLYFFSSL